MATNKKTTRQEPAPEVRKIGAARDYPVLLDELRGLIESARLHVAQMANATLTMLYWRIGQRIGVELLKKERAAYGQEIVYAVSRELTHAYGKGFTDRNLWHMRRFAGYMAVSK